LSVTEHCNSRRVIPINMCDRHKSSNTRTATKTPTHLGFAASTVVPPRLLHPIHQCASAIGRAGLRSHRPQRSYTGRGQIRFLKKNLRDCPLASSSSSSPRPVYLFISHTSRVVVFNVNFVRPIVVFIRSSSRNRKSCTVSALKLCITYLICI
jgi:hypothetical protein